MAVSQFNLITATSSLESTGLPRAQAERITGIVQQAMEALISSLATKADLADSHAATQAALDTFRAETQAAIDILRADVKAVKTDMATKADLAALKAELFRVLWMLSLGLATVILTGTGVLLALFRMF